MLVNTQANKFQKP